MLVRQKICWIVDNRLLIASEKYRILRVFKQEFFRWRKTLFDMIKQFIVYVNMSVIHADITWGEMMQTCNAEKHYIINIQHSK